MTNDEIIKLIALFAYIGIFAAVLFQFLLTIREMRHFDRQFKNDMTILGHCKNIVKTCTDMNDVIAYESSYTAAICKVLEEKKIINKYDKKKIMYYKNKAYKSYEEGKKKCKNTNN